MLDYSFRSVGSQSQAKGRDGTSDSLRAELDRIGSPPSA